MFSGVLKQRKNFASMAARPKKLLLTLFRRTGCNGQKWPKGLDLNKNVISILSAIFDPYDQSIGMKSEEVFLLAGQPNWLIAAAEANFLRRFRHPDVFTIPLAMM